MADPGTRETDEIVKEIERRITVEYQQAARELKAKVDDYWRRHKAKDEKWQEWVREGSRTEDEYKAWLASQLANGERWEKMRDTIAEDLLNVSRIAKSIAQGYMPEVYSTNFAYGTYDIERKSGIDTSFTLYSRESMEFLFREDPEILPGPGKKVSKEIAEGRAKRWNKQHVQSVMAQAILQGNSVPDIATRLSNAVCDSDRKAAIRNARTMATGTQNAGRIDAYKRGEEYGIKSKKRWVATLDMRTRHEHRLLDGMTSENGEPFVVEGEKIRYPGDPQAAPHLVYNCRCTLIAQVAGWTSNAEAHRSQKRLEEEGLDYEAWKKSRVEKPNPIDLPERKREAIRAQYIRGYRGYGGPVKEGMDRTLDIDSRHVSFDREAAKNTGGTPQPATTNTKGGKKTYKDVDQGTLRETIGYSAYNEYKKVLKGVSETIRKIHEKYLKDVIYINLDIHPDKIGARWNSFANTLHYNTKTSGDQEKFTTLFHESGHAIDSKIDSSLKDLEFEEYDTITKIVGLSSYTKENVPSCSDMFLDAMREDIAVIKRAVFYDTWESINSDLMAHHSTVGVQDFLDGIFPYRTAINPEGKHEQKHIKINYGHGDVYYDQIAEHYLSTKSQHNKAIKRSEGTNYEGLKIVELKMMCRDYITASELWANINSALVCGGTAEKFMRMFAPNAVEAYLKIMEMASNE